MAAPDSQTHEDETRNGRKESDGSEGGPVCFRCEESIKGWYYPSGIGLICELCYEED